MPKDTRLLTENELAQVLREECSAAGTQLAWAKTRSVSVACVCEALKGQKRIGQRLANALGYERVVLYRPIEKDDESAPIP